MVWPLVGHTPELGFSKSSLVVGLGYGKLGLSPPEMQEVDNFEGCGFRARPLHFHAVPRRKACCNTDPNTWIQRFLMQLSGPLGHAGLT